MKESKNKVNTLYFFIFSLFHSFIKILPKAFRLKPITYSLSIILFLLTWEVKRFDIFYVVGNSTFDHLRQVKVPPQKPW